MHDDSDLCPFVYIFRLFYFQSLVSVLPLVKMKKTIVTIIFIIVIIRRREKKRPLITAFITATAVVVVSSVLVYLFIAKFISSFSYHNYNDYECVR